MSPIAALPGAVGLPGLRLGTMGWEDSARSRPQAQRSLGCALWEQMREVATAEGARAQEPQGSEIGVQRCLLPVQVNRSPGGRRPQAQGHRQEVTAGK